MLANNPSENLVEAWAHCRSIYMLAGAIITIAASCCFSEYASTSIPFSLVADGCIGGRPVLCLQSLPHKSTNQSTNQLISQSVNSLISKCRTTDTVSVDMGSQWGMAYAYCRGPCFSSLVRVETLPARWDLGGESEKPRTFCLCTYVWMHIISAHIGI